MAMLDKGLKQRIVGALVLLALAVIFLPMLFSRQDEMRQVVVDAPSMPKAPEMPAVAVQPTAVPEPKAVDAEVAQPQAPAAEQAPVQAALPVPSTPVAQPSAPIATLPQPVAPAPRPAAPVQQQAAAPAPAQHLDGDNLPVSWSVQLASLSNRARADELQKTLRSQGYNAYVRSVDGMNRVFVGPLVERAEADRLKEQLSKQQKLNGFVVRFQPERG